MNSVVLSIILTNIGVRLMDDFSAMILELDYRFTSRWRCLEWVAGTVPYVVDLTLADVADDPRWWRVARFVGGLA